MVGYKVPLNTDLGPADAKKVQKEEQRRIDEAEELTEEELEEKVESTLKKYNLDYNLEWKLSGAPFLTDSGSLIDAATTAIKEIVGIDTVCSTGGGTSDGRFIAPTGAQTIELGVVNETIHKINECVKVEDLDTISDIYERVLDKLLSN